MTLGTESIPSERMTRHLVTQERFSSALKDLTTLLSGSRLGGGGNPDNRFSFYSYTLDDETGVFCFSHSLKKHSVDAAETLVSFLSMPILSACQILLNTTHCINSKAWSFLGLFVKDFNATFGAGLYVRACYCYAFAV